MSFGGTHGDWADFDKGLVMCVVDYFVCGKLYSKKAGPFKNGSGECDSFYSSAQSSLPKEACCDCYPNCLSNDPNDPSTKPYPARVDCSMNVTPTIEIDLPQTLNIDDTPKMPDLTAAAKVTPEDAPVSWKARLTYKSGHGSCKEPHEVNFDSGEVTGEGPTFEPNFGGMYGGDLEITATTTCGNGATKTEKRKIGGVTPKGADVRTEIGDLNTPFDKDDLKRIACRESEQTQFTANNTPKFSDTGGGDVGIGQICYGRKIEDFWNWKTNIADARARLLYFLGEARKVPRRVRTTVVRGMGPFPEATEFTPEQLRLEAIKEYNAGNDPESGYWEWDDQAGSWVANPQHGGDPGYVDHVLAKNPNCRQP